MADPFPDFPDRLGGISEFPCAVNQTTFDEILHRVRLGKSQRDSEANAAVAAGHAFHRRALWAPVGFSFVGRVEAVLGRWVASHRLFSPGLLAIVTGCGLSRSKRPPP